MAKPPSTFRSIHMPFELDHRPPRRIAVIGGGISGMSAAHFLAKSNAVTLFEADNRLGGHARTVLAGKRGDQPVDTGFIVFNHVNYPHLVRLFDRLDVPTAPSNMSFGVSAKGGALEYALNDLDSLFAQRRNLVSPAFLRMLRDIYHFNKNAEATLRHGMTIGGLLDALGTGPYFRDYYILPFSGAIWSTPTHGILDFPADALVRFFQNHHLMQLTGQHQWHTVQGGSVQYVQRLQADLLRQGVDLRLGCAVQGVRRVDGGVHIRAVGGEWEMFDDVVLASHSDQSLALLSDADGGERAALAAIRYQPNEMVLHCDANMMPKSRKCWASWSYVEGADGPQDKIDLSYWMNSLQPIPQDDPMFVTLNATKHIRPEMIYDSATFHHPVYDLGALAAQKTIAAMNGSKNTWFCGAWMKNGFHEDGIASAFDVAEAMRERDTSTAAA
jgi:predicted NAD/FAD-binding protein